MAMSSPSSEEVFIRLTEDETGFICTVKIDDWHSEVFAFRLCTPPLHESAHELDFRGYI